MAEGPGLGFNLGLSLEDTSEPSTDVLDKDLSPVYMCVYDFDQTITITHVYKDIIKRKSQHTESSEGDGGGDEDSDIFLQMSCVDYMRQHVSEEEVISWFGDEERRKLLHKHLQKMRSLDVELRVLSLNEAEMIKECLKIVDLGKYFSHVVGQDTKVFKQYSRKKNALLKKWSRQNHLTCADMIFVDDDGKNIKSVNAEKTALTVRVVEDKNGWGMKKVHFKSIEAHFVKARQKRHGVSTR